MISVLVSQSRGLAVFDDGKLTAALLGAESEPLALTEQELSRLLRGAHDIEALVVPSLSELRIVLHERYLREQVLHATLLFIDGQSSKSLRTTAGETLIRLAAPEAIVRWVECVLMSLPIPAEVDFMTARVLPCDDRIVSLILRVESCESRIRSVFAAFVAVCRKHGVSTSSPLRRRSVEEGWSRALVLGERLLLGESDEAWGLVQHWISTLTEVHGVPQHRSPRVTALSHRPKRGGASILLEDLDLRTAEKLLCKEALARAGSIPVAARLLGITRHALKRLLLKHRIVWPDMGVKATPWAAFKDTVGRRDESEERHRRLRRFAVGRVSKSKAIDKA